MINANAKTILFNVATIDIESIENDTQDFRESYAHSYLEENKDRGFIFDTNSIIRYKNNSDITTLISGFGYTTNHGYEELANSGVRNFINEENVFLSPVFSDFKQDLTYTGLGERYIYDYTAGFDTVPIALVVSSYSEILPCGDKKFAELIIDSQTIRVCKHIIYNPKHPSQSSTDFSLLIGSIITKKTLITEDKHLGCASIDFGSFSLDKNNTWREYYNKYVFKS